MLNGLDYIHKRIPLHVILMRNGPSRSGWPMVCEKQIYCCNRGGNQKMSQRVILTISQLS